MANFLNICLSSVKISIYLPFYFPMLCNMVFSKFGLPKISLGGSQTFHKLPSSGGFISTWQLANRKDLNWLAASCVSVQSKSNLVQVERSFLRN